MKNNRKPEIVISTNGITGTEIFINGKKLEGVTGFRFTQTYKEDNGFPRLQIDLIATNVTLESKVLPRLPEPYINRYLPIYELIESEKIPNDEIDRLCKVYGLDLEIP